MDGTEELLATGEERVALACPFWQIIVRDTATDLARGIKPR